MSDIKSLTDRALEIGWTSIHYNEVDKLVGIAPPPAHNHYFYEITEETIDMTWEQLEDYSVRAAVIKSRMWM